LIPDAPGKDGLSEEDAYIVHSTNSERSRIAPHNKKVHFLVIAGESNDLSAISNVTVSIFQQARP